MGVISFVHLDDLHEFHLVFPPNELEKFQTATNHMKREYIFERRKEDVHFFSNILLSFHVVSRVSKFPKSVPIPIPVFRSTHSSFRKFLILI